jgi:hypothetical protein
LWFNIFRSYIPLGSSPVVHEDGTGLGPMCEACTRIIVQAKSIATPKTLTSENYLRYIRRTIRHVRIQSDICRNGTCLNVEIVHR